MEGNSNNQESLSFEYYNGELAKRDEKIASLESQVNEMRELFKANFTRNSQSSNNQQSDEQKQEELKKKIKEVFR